MAWTDAARRQHMRDGSGYPSDLRMGWPPAHDLSAQGVGRNPLHGVERRGLAYAAQMLSFGFDGARLFLRLAQQWSAGDDNHLLVITARQQAGREASPTAGVIDSQSVKTTESGGVCGYDAGKKAKGRKRHIVTDTCGFLLFILVHAADIQDRAGAVDVLKAIRFRFPWLRHVFADGGYAGDKLRGALEGQGEWTLEIIKRSDAAKGFEVLPRRWVVERTFAWRGGSGHLDSGMSGLPV